MPSEDFDKRIKDAADHHHPAYNEKAWKKMEKLLNKHLPQEKDGRRRIIFFLLLFLLIDGGVWFVVSKPWKESATISQTKDTRDTGSKTGTENPSLSGPEDSPSTTATDKRAAPQIPVTNQGGNDIDNTGTTVQDPEAKANSQGKVQPGIHEKDDILIRVSPGQKGVRAKTTIKKAVATDKPFQDIAVTKRNKDAVIPAPVLPEEKAKADPVIKTEKDETVDKPAADTKPEKAVPSADSSSVVAQPKVDEKKKEKAIADLKKKAKPRGKENGLAFTVSAGPDISSVGLDKIGKLRPVFGAGLNYTFADRFTLRTGFYAASKVYTAGPEDYKPVPPPPNSNYLYEVDANCRVYEIPVNLAYSFGRSKNHNWFGAAGLSSYFMKKEVYDYTYKYPSGQTYRYTHTLNDENKHVFSVLSLSAGYTRKLNGRFALSIEPYMKVPLNGIGFGNIKLNSAGILFTFSTRLTGSKNK